MKLRASTSVLAISVAAAIFLTANVRGDETPKPPKVGDTIKDYKFRLDDKREVSLASLAKKGPVVLIVLRGFPGYQCPACSAQVAELRKQSKDLKQLGANVVLVYPGAVDDLQSRANQFLKDEKLPEPLLLVLDPKYDFVRPVGLRWNEKGETAYPATFVLDKNRVVKYAKVSKTHGDRAKAKDILAALQAINVADAQGQDIPQTR